MSERRKKSGDGSISQTDAMYGINTFSVAIAIEGA